MLTNILATIVLFGATIYAGIGLYSFALMMRKIFRADSPEARGKSRDLFIACMGPDAYYDFVRRGFVTIVGQSGNQYEVTGTVIYDVTRRRKFCFAPSEVLPKTDVLLAQIIMLKCNEREALGVAQWWTL